MKHPVTQECDVTLHTGSWMSMTTESNAPI